MTTTFYSSAAKWRAYNGSWINATTSGDYAPALAVGYTGSSHHESYWQFDLSALSGKTIKSATLRLYLKHRYGSVNPIFLKVCSGVSGNTGAYDIGSEKEVLLTGSGWKEIDILSMISNLRDDGYIRAYGKATSAIYHDFATQSAYPAQLIVEYYDVDGKINVGDTWKQIEEIKINIGDTWKSVSNLNINVNDIWKRGK